MNGYTEAWCLSFNQHLGRNLLVPVDVSIGLPFVEQQEPHGIYLTLEVMLYGLDHCASVYSDVLCRKCIQ